MSVLLLSLAGAVARADDLLQAADQRAMGSVGLADPEANGSIGLNPGLLALTERYDFEGLFGYGPDQALGWGASAMDARTSDKVAGGLFYSGSLAEVPLRVGDLPGWALPDEEISNVLRFHDVGLGLATPLADRKLSLGIGGHVGYFRHDRRGEGWRFDLNAGAAWAPTGGFTLGASARGLLPLEEQDVPFTAGIGARGKVGRFVAAGDAILHPTLAEGLPLTLAAGAEQGVATLRLRGGWRFDAPTQSHALTAGLGLQGDGAGLHYSAWIPVSGELSAAATVHTVSVRLSAEPEILPPE